MKLAFTGWKEKTRCLLHSCSFIFFNIWKKYFFYDCFTTEMKLKITSYCHNFLLNHFSKGNSVWSRQLPVLPSYPSYAEYIKFYIFLSWNASNLTASSPNKYLLMLSYNKDILKEMKLSLKIEKTKNLLLTVNLAFYLPIWLSYYLGLLTINLEVIISVKVYPKMFELSNRLLRKNYDLKWYTNLSLGGKASFRHGSPI